MIGLPENWHRAYTPLGSGNLYRSNLPEYDAAWFHEVLNDRNIAAIVDLREVPRARQLHALRLSAPVAGPGQPLLEALKAGDWHRLRQVTETDIVAEKRAYVVGLLAEDAGTDVAVSAILDVLSQGRNALVHCEAGKDRTGLVVALVQRELGCGTETILREYELANDRPTQAMRRLLASVPSDLSALARRLLAVDGVVLGEALGLEGVALDSDFVVTQFLGVITGIPGAGKTTLATRVVAEMDCIHLDMDSLAISTGVRAPHAFAIARRQLPYLLDLLLPVQVSVIVDGALPDLGAWGALREAAARHGLPLRVVEIAAAPAAAWTRIVSRRSTGSARQGMDHDRLTFTQTVEAALAVYEQIRDRDVLRLQGTESIPRAADMTLRFFRSSYKPEATNGD